MSPSRPSTSATRHRRRAVRSPPRPILRGDEIGGFAVARIRRVDPGGWTIADGTPRGGQDAPVTLWVSPPQPTADGPLRELFERLDALRRLCETSDLPLVPPRAAGAEGSRLFLARDRLRGTTLAQRLQEGALSPRQVAALATQVARGLDALHAFDVPHAPLTPDRILLLPGEPLQARLYDFGLPRGSGHACADPALLYAADYLAPEVARGAPPTAAADVYALGCVLVEAFSGAPPFPYDRPLMVLHAHAVERPRRIAAAAGLPPEIDHLLAKAMHKVPDRRPRTATGLARAVRRVLNEWPEASQPSDADPSEHASPSEVAVVAPSAVAPALRRGPSRAAVVLTVIVAACAGLATAITRSNAPSGSPAREAVAGGAAVALGPPPKLMRLVQRLDARRAQQRRALASARTAAAQSRAADALAATYAAALAAARSSASARGAALDGSLSRAEAAYRQLGAAARRGDADAYRSAAAAVVARERDAARALQRQIG